jgi:hypothetical protein
MENPVHSLPLDDFAFYRELTTDASSGSPRRGFVLPQPGNLLASSGSIPSARGHIFDGQQNERLSLLKLDPAGIEQHIPRSEVRKIMAHLKIVHAGVSRNNLLQKLA